MSTEAKGDGQRDAVGAGEQETAGGETAVPAGAAGATGASVATTAEASAAEASAAEDAAGGGEAGLSGAGEDTAAAPGGAGEVTEAEHGGAGEHGGEGEHGGRGEHGGVPVAEASPGEPIELAEPVELDEPAAAFGVPRRWTRLLLAVGFVVAAVAVVGGAIAVVGSVTHGFKKPVKVTYKKSAVFSLQAGNCFDPVGQQSYSLIPCDSPHRAEVFATFTLSGTSWPGAAAVESAASSGCAGRLTGYLNPQLALSLASAYVYPDATAWQAGTRTVICEVRAASGDITGSVRGATASAG